MIKNECLTERDQKYFEFFLCNGRFEKEIEIMLDQINHAIITKDISPYHIDYNFIQDQASVAPLEKCQFILTMQVLHKDGTVPTIFDLVVRHGYISSFEICDVNGNALDFEKLFDGEIVVDLVEF